MRLPILTLVLFGLSAPVFAQSAQAIHAPTSILADAGDETVIASTDWSSLVRITIPAQERGLNYVYRLCVIDGSGGDLSIQNDGSTGTFVAVSGRCRDVVVRSELLLRAQSQGTAVRLRYRLLAIV